MYGNLLSIMIFLFETTNVSVDWFILNILSPKKTPEMQLDRLTYKYWVKMSCFIGYVIVNKMIMTPIIIMSLYYSITSNIIQPLFMISFSFYLTHMIKMISMFNSEDG